MKNLFILLGLFVLSPTLFADHNESFQKYAPPPLIIEKGTAVPIDIKEYEAKLVLQSVDEEGFHFIVQTVIQFDLKDDGFPMFIHRNQCQTLVLDSQDQSCDVLKVVESEALSQVLNNPIRMIEISLMPGPHILELTYSLNLGRYDLSQKIGDFLFGMNDFEGRYLDQFLPANFEFDQFRLSLDLILNGLQHIPKIYTNGKIEHMGDGYHISYPAYFTSSSHYLHVVDGIQIFEKKFHLEGINRDIDVLIYTKDEENWKWFDEERFRSKFQMAESKLGPYAHETFLMQLVVDLDEIGTGWSMEYAGAAIVKDGAVTHELFHSWIGRSIMPASGNAGWIDEALVRWMESGEGSKVKDYLPKNPVKLTGFSPYILHANKSDGHNPYNEGAWIIGYLHGKALKMGYQDGLFALLKPFYSTHRNQVIENEDFFKILKPIVNDNFIQRYFLGEDVSYSD